MLTEDFDEIKGVEAEQQYQLVLTFSIITGGLWSTERRGISQSEKHTCICLKQKAKNK